MKVVPILQIMSILYFIFAVRMQMWRVSLNSFIVIATVFTIAISHEVVWLQYVWVDFHLPVIATMLTFIMMRVTWQSILTKRHKRLGGRRLTDACED